MLQERTFNGTGQLTEEIARDGGVREEVALRLTLEALRQSERALVGILALPASWALGLAASVSYAAAFVERGFQTFELSLARLARASMGERDMERERLERGERGTTILPPSSAAEGGDKAAKSARS